MKWTIKQNLDTKKLLEIYSKALFKEFYYRKKYSQSKIALVFLIKSNYKNLIKYLVYVIKLFLMPKFLLNYIRLLKNERL